MASLLRALQTWFQEQPEARDLDAGVPRRHSLGLEQFLPAATEGARPAVLDLGCVWQSTVSFLTGCGCKVYTHDLFDSLHHALAARPVHPDAPLAPLAERFLPEVLHYPEENFRGILAWDLFDYLPDELVGPLAARLHALLGPGGALYALFHNRRAGVSFRRYRIVAADTLELLPGSLPLQPRRAFSNRALLDTFAAFSSSRNFVGRDNLRELFLLK